MKRFAVILLIVAIALMSVVASGTKEASDGLSGTLTFTIWDNNLNDFIEKNDMVGKFQELYPNADIEVENIGMP